MLEIVLFHGCVLRCCTIAHDVLHVFVAQYVCMGACRQLFLLDCMYVLMCDGCVALIVMLVVGVDHNDP